jgi:hypothetical protein
VTVPSQPRTYDSILNNVISRVRTLEALPPGASTAGAYMPFVRMKSEVLTATMPTGGAGFVVFTLKNAYTNDPSVFSFTACTTAPTSALLRGDAYDGTGDHPLGIRVAGGWVIRVSASLGGWDIVNGGLPRYFYPGFKFDGQPCGDNYVGVSNGTTSYQAMGASVINNTDALSAPLHTANAVFIDTFNGIDVAMVLWHLAAFAAGTNCEAFMEIQVIGPSADMVVMVP